MGGDDCSGLVALDIVDPRESCLGSEAKFSDGLAVLVWSDEAGGEPSFSDDMERNRECGTIDGGGGAISCADLDALMRRDSAKSTTCSNSLSWLACSSFCCSVGVCGSSPA